MSDVTQRVVTKSLAGVQDIVTGIGEVTQNRAGNSLSITKLNASELQGALVVNTIEELTNLVINKLGDTKTVIVKDKDRGGIFSYDINNASTNDGGIVFNGWTRQYDGAVYVKWFGAKGDGVTDDTNLVQKALNYSFEKQKTLIIDGIYCVTRLHLDNYKSSVYTNKVISVQGYSNANNYQDQNNNSTLIALGSDNVLDLNVSNSGTSNRLTVKLSNFNIYGGQTPSNKGSIKTKHAWLDINGVSVKGCAYGIYCEESYKASFTNCSLTYNTFGIKYAGYNSVQRITGNQLRSNSTCIGFDQSYVPDASTSQNQLNQSSIKDNNMENCSNVFDFSDSQAISVYIDSNYVEGGDTLLNLTGTNTHKNVYFRGVSIGYDILLDKCISIYINSEQGSITKTSNSVDIFVEKSDTFSNIELNSILTLPRYTITTDSFFELSSIVSSVVLLPKEYYNTTVSSSTELSWETSDTWKNNPVIKITDTESGDMLRLDLPIKHILDNPYENYSYRLKCSVIYKCSSSSSFNIKKRFSTESTDTQATSTCTSTEWEERLFTLDVPNNSNSVDLKVIFDDMNGEGDFVLIGGIVVSYVENPIYQNSLSMSKILGIADTDGTTITCLEPTYVSVTPPDSDNSYYVENNGTTTPTVKHTGSGYKYCLLGITPAGIRRV